MLHGLFVTGTDTNIGKTVVAAALLHRYRDYGTLKYWKPIQTGVEQDDDTATVKLLGDCLDSEMLAPGIRLRRPLAPYLAAELSGLRISVEEIKECVANEPETVRWIVEGAGGVLVPLNDKEFMVNLMIELGMPTLVVTRSALGTINHTLMTLEALRSRTLNVAGVVIVGDPNAGNRDAIEKWGAVEVVAEIPRFANLTMKTLSTWVAANFDTQGHLASYFR